MNQDKPDSKPIPQALHQFINQHPLPMGLAVTTGSHLYGFPAPGSDYDIRGYHQRSLEQVLGLDEADQTVHRFLQDPPAEILTHELRKYLRLLLNNNGNILEEVFAPHHILSSPDHREIRDIAHDCISRAHAAHYMGMARQMRHRQDLEPLDIKPALHLYRIYLTGITLMQTARVETHLPTLNQEEHNPLTEELTNRRSQGGHTTLTQAEAQTCRTDHDLLAIRLEEARNSSQLPPNPGGRQRINDLLVRIRRREA